jgi:hypothetical protein
MTSPHPLLLLTACCALASSLCAQTATPPPRKDPFAGFGGTALDRGRSARPAASPTAAATPTTGLRLNGHWDAPGALSRGGPSGQSREFRALLGTFTTPGTDIGPYPAKRIYREVTYLLPFREAQVRLGLAGKQKSGGKSAAVGFPDGIHFVSFSPDGSRGFETRVLYDKADQVVAVEFVAGTPTALPPPPDPLPVAPEKVRRLVGRTYDFVPQGTSSVPRNFAHYSWDVGDYILVSTRGGPRVADLYLPKPMASLILHCLDTTGTK